MRCTEIMGSKGEGYNIVPFRMEPVFTIQRLVEKVEHDLHWNRPKNKVTRLYMRMNGMQVSFLSPLVSFVSFSVAATFLLSDPVIRVLLKQTSYQPTNQHKSYVYGRVEKFLFTHLLLIFISVLSTCWIQEMVCFLFQGDCVLFLFLFCFVL